jgi:hypothetical protein
VVFYVHVGCGNGHSGGTGIHSRSIWAVLLHHSERALTALVRSDGVVVGVCWPLDTPQCR